MKINFVTKSHIKKFENDISRVYETAMKTLGIKADCEVNVYEVSKRKIKKLNRLFRSVNRVTDVLSFPTLQPIGDSSIICMDISKENYPFDINPETNNIMLGDTYICYAKVKKQAKEYGNTLQREVCYLLVHSLLHLVGYDHMDEANKEQMRQMEEKILAKEKITRE